MTLPSEHSKSLCKCLVHLSAHLPTDIIGGIIQPYLRNQYLEHDFEVHFFNTQGTVHVQIGDAVIKEYGTHYARLSCWRDSLGNRMVSRHLWYYDVTWMRIHIGAIRKRPPLTDWPDLFSLSFDDFPGYVVNDLTKLCTYIRTWLRDFAEYESARHIHT